MSGGGNVARLETSRGWRRRAAGDAMPRGRRRREKTTKRKETAQVETELRCVARN